MISSSTNRIVFTSGTWFDQVIRMLTLAPVVKDQPEFSDGLLHAVALNKEALNGQIIRLIYLGRRSGRGKEYKGNAYPF